jgi:hypothetical protein
MKEGFRWLAGAIAAHKNRTVVGRIRLEEEIKLLQRLGFPTEYSYTLFFYGPYSEALHAEVRFLQAFGLVTEEQKSSKQGDAYFVLTASPDAVMAETADFQRPIDLMQEADAVVLNRTRSDLRHVPHNEIQSRGSHDAAAPKKGQQVRQRQRHEGPRASPGAWFFLFLNGTGS